MKKIILSTILTSVLIISGTSFFPVSSFAVSRLPEDDKNSLLIENEPFLFSVRQSRLRIEINSGFSSGQVSMFDILGNKVFEMPANESVEYSVANLKSGIYFIVLKGNKGNYTRKFLHKQEG